MSADRRVAIYGGSFDPVHLAHLALARTALQSLAIDEVRFVPAGQPWQKAGTRTITPAEHRIAMLREAIDGEPRFVLDAIEVDREGPSYTIDTVRALRAAEPSIEWTLLIGQDQHAGLPSWREWRELLALVALAVAARPGASPPSDPDIAGIAHAVVPLPPMDISSSEIRGRVAQGLPIGHLVPPAVASYIDRHRLYAAPQHGASPRS